MRLYLLKFPLYDLFLGSNKLVNVHKIIIERESLLGLINFWLIKFLIIDNVGKETDLTWKDGRVL